ncbi:hypothetical protein PEL8287_03396 [Roseovarius litorisediminis]|uniref:Uncharacterized protein n=1 Tax=Roseovarius litorisediminis TaxID=1312363 RepID=A0A1Y5TF03_9RHOB|nr:hypothetical protein [Roseovarius litorisediminis]SLN62294.1 hypothetical protein PEL8287_03396 [Roseovarius litorisediminis]
MTHDGSQALWVAVLMLVIADALEGVSGIQGNTVVKIDAIKQARNYLTIKNSNFDTVCDLAGIDAEFLRERMTGLIAMAPSPDDLVNRRIIVTPIKMKVRNRGYKQNRRRPEQAGVVSNLGVFLGTGAGRDAQETPKISFSKRKAS